MKIEEPVTFLKSPTDTASYHVKSDGDVTIYVKKTIKSDKINIKLRKVLFIKYIVVDGIERRGI